MAPSKNVLLLGRWEETTADGRHIRSKSLLLQRRRWNPFNSFPSGTLWWHIEHRGIEACGRIENLTFDGTLFPWINSWLRLTYPRYIIHVDMDEMIGILLCGTHSLVVANLEWTKKKNITNFWICIEVVRANLFCGHSNCGAALFVGIPHCWTPGPCKHVNTFQFLGRTKACKQCKQPNTIHPVPNVVWTLEHSCCLHYEHSIRFVFNEHCNFN